MCDFVLQDRSKSTFPSGRSKAQKVLCMKEALLDGLSRQKQALLLGKVSPGCSLAGAGPLKSHLSWSFTMVIMDTVSSSHLVLKLMWFFTVGFPFSFVLRMPGPFLKKQHPLPRCGFSNFP